MTGRYAAMGMATPEQMAAMAAAKGPAFDRLFLERMITHHQGAVTMAEGLLKRGVRPPTRSCSNSSTT